MQDCRHIVHRWVYADEWVDMEITLESDSGAAATARIAAGREARYTLTLVEWTRGRCAYASTILGTGEGVEDYQRLRQIGAYRHMIVARGLQDVPRDRTPSGRGTPPEAAVAVASPAAPEGACWAPPDVLVGLARCVSVMRPPVSEDAAAIDRLCQAGRERRCAMIGYLSLRTSEEQHSGSPVTLNAGEEYADFLFWQDESDDHASLYCKTKNDARTLLRYFERVFCTYNSERRATIANVTFSDEADETGDFLGVRDASTSIRWRLPEGKDRTELLHMLETWLAWVERGSMPDREEVGHA